MAPKVIMDAEALTLRFVKFASGFDTFAERRHFLDLRPDLLTPEAIGVANDLILQWKQQNVSQPLPQLRLFRNLLERAMQVGVDQAFQEFQSISEESHKYVSALFRSDTPHELFHQLFAGRSVFSTLSCLSIFHHLRAEYEDDPPKLRRIEAMLGALAMVNPYLKQHPVRST